MLLKCFASIKSEKVIANKKRKNIKNRVYDKTSFFRLESRTTKAERKNEHLEAQSTRDNWKFFGIEDQENETWEPLDDKVREYMRKELNLDDRKIKTERAHQLPSRSSPRPIFVKISFYKDRKAVFSDIQRETQGRQQRGYEWRTNGQ